MLRLGAGRALRWRLATLCRFVGSGLLRAVGVILHLVPPQRSSLKGRQAFARWWVNVCVSFAAALLPPPRAFHHAFAFGPYVDHHPALPCRFIHLARRAHYAVAGGRSHVGWRLVSCWFGAL